jgi:hypothetical protein
MREVKWVGMRVVALAVEGVDDEGDLLAEVG